MKNILLFTVLVSMTNFCFTQNETDRGYKVKVGEQVPNMKMKMRNGDIWTNNDIEIK